MTDEPSLDAPAPSRASTSALPVVAGVALVVGAVLFSFSTLTGDDAVAPAPGPGGGGKPMGPPAGKPTAVRVVAVEEGALTAERRIPGEILPTRRAALRAEAGGTLVRLKKRLGDVVAPGELLGVIDAGTLPFEVKRAEAMVRAAEARAARVEVDVAQRERDVARKQKLEGEGAVARTERERVEHELALARADLEIARAEIARTAAELDILRVKLDDTRVIAPFSGRVARVHVDEGTVVTPGQSIVDVVTDELPYVAFAVREVERQALKPGAPVEVSVDGRALTGEVLRIGAEVDPASRTVLIEARLFPDAGPPLLPGTFVDVRVALGATENALVVPEEALVGRGPVRTVFVVEDGRARAVEARVLLEDGETAAVSGPAKGARVVVEGRDQVKDGATVEVVQ